MSSTLSQSKRRAIRELYGLTPQFVTADAKRSGLTLAEWYADVHSDYAAAQADVRRQFRASRADARREVVNTQAKARRVAKKARQAAAMDAVLKTVRNRDEKSKATRKARDDGKRVVRNTVRGIFSRITAEPNDVVLEVWLRTVDRTTRRTQTPKIKLVRYRIASSSTQWNTPDFTPGTVFQTAVELTDQITTDYAELARAAVEPGPFHDALDQMADGSESEAVTYASHLKTLLSPMVFAKIITNTKHAASFKAFGQTRVRDTANVYSSSLFLEHELDSSAISFSSGIKPCAKSFGASRIEGACGFDAIMAGYEESYNAYYGKLKRAPKTLTNESIFQTICGRPMGAEDAIGELSIDELERWFIAERHGLEIVDADGILLHRYMPEKVCTHVKPACLRLSYWSHHLSTIDNIRSFEQKQHDDPSIRPPSASFTIRERRPCNAADYIVCSDVDELWPAVSRAKEAGTMEINLVFAGHLHPAPQGHTRSVLEYIMKDHGCTPRISTSSGATVTCIVLDRFVDGTTVRITSASAAIWFTEVGVDTAATYAKYKNLKACVEHALISKATLSTYHPSTIDAYSQFMPPVPLGSMADDSSIPRSMDSSCGLDYNKQYASCMAKLPFIPVVHPWDRLYACDEAKEGIKDTSMYLAKVHQRSAIFSKEHQLMFGYQVKQIRALGTRCTLVERMDAHAKSSEHVNGAIESVWSPQNADINADLLKAIPNVMSGMLGKTWNTKRVSAIFNYEGDAMHYISDRKAGKAFPMDEQGSMYVVNSSARTRLTNGFLPIRVALLVEAQIQMLSMQRAIEAAGIRPLAVKTDCIYIEATAAQAKRIKGIPFGSTMGQVKIIDFKCVTSSLPPTQYEDSPLRHVPAPPRPQKAMSDIRDYMGVRPNSFVSAFAGVGKSHLCAEYAKSRFDPKEVLVIAAYNSQAKGARKHGFRGVTAHKALNVDIAGRAIKRKPLDFKEYKCVILEEAMLLTPGQMVSIYLLMQKHANIVWLGTGDEHQLAAIGDDTTIEEKVDMMRKMFKHHTCLTGINRRMKSIDDARTMGAIQQDIFTHKMTPAAIIHKYFPTSSVGSLEEVVERGIKRGVSYLDSSSLSLNKLMHQRDREGAIEIMGIGYYTGMQLICKSNTNIKPLNPEVADGDTMMRRNYIYEVVAFEEDQLVLEDIDTGVQYPVSHQTIGKSFTLPYCNTVHSSQGGEINEPFVIADAHMGAADWFYTAISRATRIKDIHFLVCDMTEANMEAVFARKIEQAKVADQKRGLTIDESTYITVGDCIGMYSKCRLCPGCRGFMGYQKGSERQVTIDRTDNHIGHVKGNCRLLCLSCNKAKK